MKNPTEAEDDDPFHKAIMENGDENNSDDELDVDEENEDDKKSTADGSNQLEPYFTLLNCRDHFKIICQTLDFDDSQLKPKPLYGKTLYIKKEGCIIYEKDDDDVSLDLESIEAHNQIQHHGVLGVLSLMETELFLVIVTASAVAGRCPQGHQIHQITQVDFIPFFSKIEADGKHSPPLSADVVKQLKGVQKLLEEQHFYFSYYADLSSNQERQSIERADYLSENKKAGRDALWWRRPKINESDESNQASNLATKQEESK